MQSRLILSLFLLAGISVSFATDAQQQDHQRNYDRCLHGYASCDPSQLSEAEKPAVQQAAHQRNYNKCLHGYVSCDPSQLSEAEKPAVQQAIHQRNYNKCLHGYAGCDPSQLFDSEQSAVQEAAHQRNYKKCLHGYVGCDASLLTESEKASISAQSQAPAVPQSPPRYYTNKDGQRVQSPTYYDKTPAGATAQCRDGTYSFSQHRQGTCSHHGGVAKWL